MPLEAHLFGVASYGIAALGYAAITLLLILNHPGGQRASLLATATGVSFLWAAVFAFLLFGEQLSVAAAVSLDSAHLLVWIVCICSFLEGFTWKRWPAIAAVLAAAVLGVSSPIGQRLGFAWIAAPAVLAMTVLGLVLAEQVLRNAREKQRRHLRLLCLATGAIFAIDLFVYAEASLFNGLAPYAWNVRGFTSVATLPLIVLATKRQSEWQHGLFVSRQVTFYAASLIAAGIYLLVMALVAYALRYFGRDWDERIALLFMIAAIALLVFIFYSVTLRIRFRAFLIRHFYRYKYDYRLEWLRLTQSLGRSSDLGVLAANSLAAMAQIAGSRKGQLWFARDVGRYELMASLPPQPPANERYDADHPMVRFLASRSWVIDSAEYGAEPDRYQNAFGDPSENVLPRNSIVVPLDCQGSLQGFVTMENPVGAGTLRFEDHDILKTSGRQVAVALAQALSLEKLAETRQFEAMNKMSTFLMHDLKNVLAQQQLIVSNAARFRQRPEFVDDAIATIRSGAERMRNVLEQLEGSRAKAASGGRADLSKALIEVRSHCADRQPIPEVACPFTGLWVPIERERLVNILTHLVRNAQDATSADGSIRIAVAVAGKEIVCTVSDTGCGMDQLFIRDHLFRPFFSTKGAAGMGIGAYQVREMVVAAGGSVEVASTLRVGTTFTLRFSAKDVALEAATPSKVSS
jgi:putative PEP-CTERM system histidine kinase